MAPFTAEAATQEVIRLLVVNGHEEVAQLLSQHLAAAQRGDIGAMNEIIALTHIRALGDLMIVSVEWLKWLGKLNELRQRWQRVIRNTTSSSSH
jgi:hypothetical protein